MSGVANYTAHLALVEKLDRLYPDFVATHQRERSRWLSRIHCHLGFGYLRDKRLSPGRRLWMGFRELAPRLPLAIWIVVEVSMRGLRRRMKRWMARVLTEDRLGLPEKDTRRQREDS